LFVAWTFQSGLYTPIAYWFGAIFDYSAISLLERLLERNGRLLTTFYPPATASGAVSVPENMLEGRGCSSLSHHARFFSPCKRLSSHKASPQCWSLLVV